MVLLQEIAFTEVPHSSSKENCLSVCLSALSWLNRLTLTSFEDFWARILTKRARRRWARQRSGVFICNWYWIVLLLFRWYLIYHFCLSQLISEQHYLVLRAVPLGRPRPLLWEKSGWGGGVCQERNLGPWGEGQRCFMDLGGGGQIQFKFVGLSLKSLKTPIILGTKRNLG